VVAARIHGGSGWKLQPHALGQVARQLGAKGFLQFVTSEAEDEACGLAPYKTGETQGFLSVEERTEAGTPMGFLAKQERRKAGLPSGFEKDLLGISKDARWIPPAHAPEQFVTMPVPTWSGSAAGFENLWTMEGSASLSERQDESSEAISEVGDESLAWSEFQQRLCEISLDGGSFLKKVCLCCVVLCCVCVCVCVVSE
jgi:hypothetical protein